MRVRDEMAWQTQLGELEADEYTRKFKAFLVAWANNLDVVHETPGWSTRAEQLSKALEVTEQTFGYLSVEWMAQMMLVICDYWTNGEACYESLSRIEKRLIDQAAAVKLEDLASGASLTTDE